MRANGLVYSIRHDHIGILLKMDNIKAEKDVIEEELLNRGMTYSFSEGFYHDNETTCEILLKISGNFQNEIQYILDVIINNTSINQTDRFFIKCRKKRNLKKVNKPSPI